MLVSARALLDRNPRPSRDEVIEAISGNPCRCTGYEPIITAILAVAETTLPEAPSADFRVERAVSTGEALELALALPEADAPEITLASGGGFIVEAPAGAMKDGFYTITIPVDSLPDGQKAVDGDWLLLAKAGDRAMETPLVFETVSP